MISGKKKKKKGSMLDEGKLSSKFYEDSGRKIRGNQFTILEITAFSFRVQINNFQNLKKRTREETS
jgi:hypothetical protein